VVEEVVVEEVVEALVVVEEDVVDEVLDDVVDEVELVVDELVVVEVVGSPTTHSNRTVPSSSAVTCSVPVLPVWRNSITPAAPGVHLRPVSIALPAGAHAAATASSAAIPAPRRRSSIVRGPIRLLPT
jgi:hypothetical protein